MVEISLGTYGIVDNLDNLIDFNDNTYNTFHNDDNLIVSFSNSTIVDMDGPDIEFITQNNEYTSLSAYVSVSTINHHDYKYLGILNQSHTSFDLRAINYS